MPRIRIRVSRLLDVKPNAQVPLSHCTQSVRTQIRPAQGGAPAQTLQKCNLPESGNVADWAAEFGGRISQPFPVAATAQDRRQ